MDKNYMVTKSNILISAGYNLSAYEQKLILTLASLVQPDDKDFEEYTFKVREFMNLLGVANKNHYREALKVTKGLMKKVFEIREGNTIKQLAWLCCAIYKLREGTITLKFAPDLRPYMLYLKEFYTTYKLENVLGLKSKYSIRLYEILKSNAWRGFVEVKLSELKRLTGATAKYLDVYADFKKIVLNQAEKEINGKTDIKFTYTEIRESWKIKAIRFVIATNYKMQFENQLSVDDVLEENGIFERAKKILNTKEISKSTLERLIDAYGEDKITYYLDNWHRFANLNLRNKVGFFINCIKKGYAFPEQQFGKPAQATNYEQRQHDEYDDDFYESLYWRPEHDQK